jgi:hypothetical protein
MIHVSATDEAEVGGEDVSETDVALDSHTLGYDILSFKLLLEVSAR